MTTRDAKGGVDPNLGECPKAHGPGVPPREDDNQARFATHTQNAMVEVEAEIRRLKKSIQGHNLHIHRVRKGLEKRNVPGTFARDMGNQGRNSRRSKETLTCSRRNHASLGYREDRLASQG
jgi:hypothetical protein